MLITVLAAAAGVLAACGSNKLKASNTADTTGIPSGPIVIGLPIAMTGAINFYDGNVLLGAQVEANQLNAAGGIDGHKIKLVTADTASDIAQGTTAAQQVVSQGAQFLITTPDYNYGGGAARVGQSRNLIVMSGPDDTRYGLSIGDNVFDLNVGGPTQGAALAQYANATLHWKRAYIVQDTTLASATSVCIKGFEAAFKELGGSVTADQFQQASQSSVDSAVSRLQSAASKYDGVMLCGTPPAGATTLRQIRSSGVKLPILLSTGFDSNSWQSAVPNLGPTYVISFGPVTPGEVKDPPAKAAFEAAAKQGKSVTQSLSYLTGYSAVEAFADAVKATNSVSADKIRPYLQQFRDKTLAIGPTTWTAQCHARVGNPMVIAGFKNGKEIYVQSVTPSKVPAGACQ